MAKIEHQLHTDQFLVNRALTGELNAFREIIKKTERLTADICFKMVNNAEDRKDIVQDIYLKAWKYLPGFRFQSQLTTWVAQIAYNTCLNYLDKKRLPVVSTQLAEGLSEEQAFNDNDVYGSSLTEPELLLFRSETKKIIGIAIENLPPVYKTVITLFHYHEISYEEIAVITSLPVGTVKSHLYRARKRLKEYLLRHYKKEEL